MASAVTIRARQDPHFDNIKDEWRRVFGVDPSATARVSALRETLRKHYASGGSPNAALTGGKDDGNPKTPLLQILSSNEMEWYWDTKTKKWSVVYGLPNSSHQLVFEVEPDQFKALWGDAKAPPAYKIKTLSTLIARGDHYFAGNISEMEGHGDFREEYNKVIDLAKDNGSLPSWMANNAAAWDAIFVAQTEKKSDTWLYDQFAKLPEFKARFPNIEKIRQSGNLTLPEAVEGFLQFEAGVKQTATAMGFQGPDSNQITPQVVGGLIERGWSLQATNDALGNFKRMQDHQPALEAFNKILEANGKAPLSTVAEYYNFLKGNATADYYDLYEASSVQEAADKAGLGAMFSAQDSINAALAGEYTLESANEGMQKAAQLLLRLRGEVDSGKFGLTQDELIDASLGLKPTSGRSETQIFEEINRATLAAQANLKGRVQSYKGFDQSGRVGSQSLGALRQES